jgi:hypothetical protein
MARIWPFVPDSGRIGQSLTKLAAIWSPESGNGAGSCQMTPAKFWVVWPNLMVVAGAGIQRSKIKLQGPYVVDLATNKFQCMMVADSHKRACKNEEFKSRK